MTELEFVEYIYDPVWKNIPITQLEKDIIESDIFKRLKNIKQMSLASISFSGANHTRFEHSIGTMHVAYLVASKIEELKENANLIFNKKYGIENGYTTTLQFIRIAGLLHDLGHPPFSHAIEWVFERNPELYPGKKYSHDLYTQKLIKKNKILKNILNDKIISVVNIANFLANKLENIPKPIAILYPLLNGDLDFDKIDYIIRDNYHCGLPANIDIHSIMDSFKIRILKREDKEHLTNIEIMFKPEKLYVVENLLHSRKQLITIIQQEKKNRIANQMLMTCTQNYLRNMKDNLDIAKYTQLIQNLHEIWNDYDLVAHVNQVSYNEKPNYMNRALKGNLLLEIIKIDFADIEPSERLELYTFDKFKDKKKIFEENISKRLKSDLLVDFVFIKPPPLTIKLTPDYDEKIVTREYRNEPFSYALHSKSNVINGILKDSYINAFIAVYGEKKKYNINKLVKDLRYVIRLQNTEIRKELLKKNEIIGEDLILLVLAAIRRIFKENLEISRLWITGVKHFQDFIYKFKKIISLKCPCLDYLRKEYSSSFDSLMTKLVTLGLIDQRKKHVTIKTEKDDNFKYRIIERNDYCLNRNGENYVDNLTKDLLIIRDDLYDKMILNFKLYQEYLTRNYDLFDVLMQKSKRPAFESKILPIVDI